MKQTIILASLALTAFLSAKPSIDLSGEWRFALDAEDRLIDATPEGWKFPDTIKLPGAVTNQGFGEAPSIRTKWTAKSTWRYPEMFKEWQADD
ncbi:MAG TPA: hypothetical protein VFY13_02245, partial [Luteolibacter sp.]|nr:hypothetical protein [Luteolibacter sp.]